VSPLLSGITISAARAPQPLGLTALVAGGVQEYTRLLRMLVWAVVPLGVAGALAAIAITAADKYGQQAILAADASRVNTIALLVAGLLVLLADTTLDAGRAALAIDRRRRSAVVAWKDGCKLVLRRPLATFGTYLGISATGLGFAALLAVARVNVPALGFGGFIAAFALTQLAVMAIAWMRSARLIALMEQSRAARP
jgi:hypothetical protein